MIDLIVVITKMKINLPLNTCSLNDIYIIVQKKIKHSSHELGPTAASYEYNDCFKQLYVLSGILQYFYQESYFQINLAE